MQRFYLSNLYRVRFFIFLVKRFRFFTLSLPFRFIDKMQEIFPVIPLRTGSHEFGTAQNVLTLQAVFSRDGYAFMMIMDQDGHLKQNFIWICSLSKMEVTLPVSTKNHTIFGIFQATLDSLYITSFYVNVKS